MKCKQCGADCPGDAKFCGYCGSHFPEVKSESLNEENSREEIFDLIEQSSEYENRKSVARLEKLSSIGIGLLIPAVFLVVWIFGALFMATMMFSQAGPMGFVPLLMSGAGVVMLFIVVKKAMDFNSAPIISMPAIVVAKRTLVSGGGKNSSASTTYFITCENKNGRRKEYQVYDVQGAIYGRIAEEDAGVLFTRAKYAIGFDRVVV